MMKLKLIVVPAHIYIRDNRGDTVRHGAQSSTITDSAHETNCALILLAEMQHSLVMSP